MIKHIRDAYNKSFTEEKYAKLNAFVDGEWNHPTNFRVAETPVFIPDKMKSQLMEACTEINKVITQSNFKELTQNAIKHPSLSVPNEDYHTRFLQMDFGICKDENGELIPQLIEIQGFPSLYFFQDLLSKAYAKFFDIPEAYSVYFDGLNSNEYIELLRNVIVGDFNPKNVVLLEIEPEKQVTAIDFYGAEHHLGIKVLCISQMKKRGKRLFYLDEKGEEIPIKRIYNRVIFDELYGRDDLKREFYFKDEVDVEWVGHPNWFFRISKYTMPLFKSKYVPECFYLNELESYPEDLENYVLKPLYSFAGTGVKLHITKADLDAIEEKENFILQKKVEYAPVIETPSGLAKFEIRMLMLWESDKQNVRIVNNLVRLSKGEMVGVRYNRDKDWVGGSVGFFNKGI